MSSTHLPQLRDNPATGNTPSANDPRGKRPLILRVGRRIRPKINGWIKRFSKIPNTPFINPDFFPWIAKLEAHTDAIREEALKVLRYQNAIPPLNEISPDHARIASDGKWKSFFLYGYGFRQDENCARAPVTANLVAAIPGLNSAFFSILQPGAHIPRHKGVTNGLVTAHLGVIIPRQAEKCRIEVDDQTNYWREGKMLVFDDSMPHEVWNDTEELRCILLIQIKRPLSWPGRIIANAFIGVVRRTRFVSDARGNLDDWEAAFKRAEMNEQV